LIKKYKVTRECRGLGSPQLKAHCSKHSTCKIHKILARECRGLGSPQIKAHCSKHSTCKIHKILARE
ncbi:MAG: hypothetical protein MR582_03225, partial [Campylobacter sp.]|nr:hypothetical protein [Campylobacter sp.]